MIDVGNGGGGSRPPKGRGPNASPKNTKGKSGATANRDRRSGIKRVRGALNPPFDPRMRRMGSPLNQSHKIKRGWIQSGPYEDTDNRVNFLFNPSSIDAAHQVNPEVTRNPKQKNPNDPTDPFYTSTGSAVNISLLYDRTYEMFSPYRGSRRNLANQYGVFADVAAWYYFTKMIDELPAAPERSANNRRFIYDWSEMTIKQPMNLVMAYLFVGPRLMFYGYVSSLNVTYTHFSQHMIPIRCKVDISFAIMPDIASDGGGGGGPAKGSREWKNKHFPGWENVDPKSGWGYEGNTNLFQGAPSPIPRSGGGPSTPAPYTGPGSNLGGP